MLHCESVRPDKASRQHSPIIITICLGLGFVILSLLTLSAQHSLVAAPLKAPAPAVIAIAPSEVYNYFPNVITITGTDFVATPTASLNDTLLKNVTFINSASLTATVPPDLPGGVYTVTVINPDGQSASLANAFTVYRSGNGALGNWQTTSSMTIARSQFAVVQSGNYIYAIGGYTTYYPEYLDSVERAVINADGTLGTWQTLTATLTTPRIGLGAFAVGDYIYAVSGYSGSGVYYLNSVERALINADGTLGAWQVLTATLNTARAGFAVIQSGAYIYVIGGGNPSAWCRNNAERTYINADGTLGAWQVLTATLNTARAGFAAVQAGGNVYVIGGSRCSVQGGLSNVERSVIKANGTLDAWQTLTATLNMPRYALAAAQAGGHIYAIGGGGVTNSSPYYLNSVERAVINADGMLGAWETLSTTLNIERARHATVRVGSAIYAIGGYKETYPAAYLSSVEWATINPLSMVFSPAVVPGGQTATIIGANFLPTPSLRLGETNTLTVNFVSPNILTATIPAGLASGWYTATLVNPNGLVISRTNALRVGYLSYLPLCAHNYCPDFFDDFSNSASGWPIGEDSYIRTEYLNGEYRVFTKQGGYVYYFKSPSCSRDNYTVEADARWVGTSGDGYGLLFGLNANRQYYLFYVSADYGEFALLRRDPGSWAQIVPFTQNSAIHTGTASNHLKATRNGDQITLEVNGAVLGTWYDGTITGSTSAGVFSAPYSNIPNSDARFDNFYVTGLPGVADKGSASVNSRHDQTTESNDPPIVADRVRAPDDLAHWTHSGKSK